MAPSTPPPAGYGLRTHRRRRGPVVVSALVVITLLALAIRHSTPSVHLGSDLTLKQQHQPHKEDLPGHSSATSFISPRSTGTAQPANTGAAADTEIDPLDENSPPPPSSSPPPRRSSDPSACFKQHPWIEPALEHFFEPARESAATALESSEESLDAMDETEWVNGYHPGHDRVTLQYNDTLGRYTMNVDMRSPPNQDHKRRCILPILEAALEVHGADLAEQLQRRDIQLVVETEDFGMVWRGQASKLPAFALCTDHNHIDIPIPDFTFGCYPEARYANTSWPAIANLLSAKATMLPWRDRQPAIFHRSNWGVGPRQSLMPLLQSIHDQGRDKEVLGAEIDVGNTGFQAADDSRFVWLDSQCENMVQIHTAGFSYSAALKYKLACGSLVVKFESKYEEFYEPALVDGVHVVKLPAGEDGVDEAEFYERSAPKIKEAVEAAVSGEEMSDIARAGQLFAMQNLTSEALSCYWYGALQRYAELYFMEETEAQKASRKKAEAKAAAGKGKGKSKGKEGGRG